MTYEAFDSYVAMAKQALLQQLPGLAAQIMMAPEGRINKDYEPEPETARRGAVLILLYPGIDGVSIPLIKRPEGPSVHSGQIAFPGGAHESPERFPIDTALRETEEEIGIAPDSVEVLGLLSPLYIPPSNFSITPVVGAIRESEPTFVPEPNEVTTIIQLALDRIPHSKKTTRVVGSRGPVLAPCYHVGSTTVWGATAMMLSEYLTIHIQVLKVE